MDPEAAARAIVAWVEKRFYREFWYCRQCAWELGYANYEHHSRISNFGFCTSCHSQEDSEQMDEEASCDNCGDCYVCRGTSKYVKEFHARRALRWVGPRMERHYDRLEATRPRWEAAMERRFAEQRRAVEERERVDYAAWMIARWIEAHYKSV